jgi:hypothetical protein
MVKMSREKFRSLCNRLGLECKYIDDNKYGWQGSIGDFAYILFFENREDDFTVWLNGRFQYVDSIEEAEQVIGNEIKKHKIDLMNYRIYEMKQDFV